MIEDKRQKAQYVMPESMAYKIKFGGILCASEITESNEGVAWGGVYDH